MKKLLFCFSMLFCLSNVVNAECNGNVIMTHQIKGTSHSGYPKSPILTWYIDITGHVITMTETPCDYTLCLYDEDGVVVYSVFVPAGTTQVVLPNTLSGDYELRFETDTYYYYGFIHL